MSDLLPRPTIADTPIFGEREKPMIAMPMPPDCDKVGEGPCGTATGQGGDQPDDDGGTTTDPDGSGGGGTTDPGGDGPVDPGSPDAAPGGGTPEVDPLTGEPEVVTGDSGGTTDEAVFASATELAAARPADNKPFAWLAIGLLVGLVVLPGVYAASLRRRTSSAGGVTR